MAGRGRRSRAGRNESFPIERGARESAGYASDSVRAMAAPNHSAGKSADRFDSGDSTRLAGEEDREETSRRALCSIGVDGDHRRRLCADVRHVAWSSDGRKVLGMTMGKKDNPACLVWVSAEDGSVEKRVEFPTKTWQAVSLSPAGRCLAFDRPQEGDPNASWFAGRWDIFALDLNTGQQSAIARNPAGEVLLGLGTERQICPFPERPHGDLGCMAPACG
jgi:hypothetical protein